MDNIFGSIANGVITTDANGMITTYNAGASLILRLPPGKVMGMHYRDAFQSLPANVGLIDLLVNASMAIFNAPLQQDDHALRAVRAAWKMRVAVQEYQRLQPQEIHVSFGIGVNTGLATVGNVNVASRLQNNVSDNNILLNESTYHYVQNSVNVGKPFALNVKNKSAPLTVRYLFSVL